MVGHEQLVGHWKFYSMQDIRKVGAQILENYKDLTDGKGFTFIRRKMKLMFLQLYLEKFFHVQLPAATWVRVRYIYQTAKWSQTMRVHYHYSLPGSSIRSKNSYWSPITNQNPNSSTWWCQETISWFIQCLNFLHRLCHSALPVYFRFFSFGILSCLQA